MKAILFAAGLGTRLRPWTDHHPKILATVKNKTILEHTIRYLQSHNIYDVILNIHYHADQVKHAVEDNTGRGSNVTFLQGEQMLETGGAILAAKDLIATDETFVAINGDLVTNIDITHMISQHTQDVTNPLATLAVSDRETSRYLLFDDNQTLAGRTNIQTGEILPEGLTSDGLTQKAFNAIHVISSRIFDYARAEKNGSIITQYLAICDQARITYMDTSDDVFLDIGTPQHLALAQTLDV